MRTWDERPRWQDPLVAVVLSLWTLFVYRRGLWSLPRGDQLGFLMERDRIDGTLDWLVHCLLYNRSRVLTGEAHYLFRPLHSFTLGLEEVWFRHAPLAQGLLSLALHVAVVFALYRLVGRLAGSGTALLATVAFATQYAGMEMIVWRHISPYMWASLFLALGLLQALEAKPRAGWIGGLLLLACLAHETVPVALGAVLLALLVARADRSTIRGVGGALFAWVALDLVDYALHPTPTIADPASALQPGFDLFQGALRMLDMLGVCVLAWLEPSLVDLRWAGEEGPYARLRWDFTAIPEAVRIAAGVVLALVLCCVVAVGWKRLRMGDATGLPALVLPLHLGVLAVGFTAVRTAFRAYTYLEIATYYFYVTSFAFLVIAAQGIAFLRATAPRAGRIAMMGGWAIAAIWTATSYRGIQRALTPYEPFARMALSSARSIREALEPRTDLCFGGSFDPIARSVLSPASGPLVMLGEVACTVRRDATGTYLSWLGDGYGLVTLPPAVGAAWPLEAGPGWIADAGGVRAATTGSNETASTFASPTFDATEVAVRVSNARDGGLWVGHTTMESYGAVAVFDGMHIEGMVRSGAAPAATVFRAHNVVHDRSFDLRVRSVDGTPLVFYEEIFVGPLTGASLTGRAGVFSHAEGTAPQTFSDLRIAESATPPPELVLRPDLPVLTGVRSGR
jgi:hypothetical protein